MRPHVDPSLGQFSPMDPGRHPPDFHRSFVSELIQANVDVRAPCWNKGIRVDPDASWELEMETRRHGAQGSNARAENRARAPGAHAPV
eukprot:324326-Pyramimonas_sp.AAC.1